MHQNAQTTGIETIFDGQVHRPLEPLLVQNIGVWDQAVKVLRSVAKAPSTEADPLHITPLEDSRSLSPHQDVSGNTLPLRTKKHPTSQLGTSVQGDRSRQLQRLPPGASDN